MLRFSVVSHLPGPAAPVCLHRDVGVGVWVIRARIEPPHLVSSHVVRAGDQLSRKRDGAAVRNWRSHSASVRTFQRTLLPGSASSRFAKCRAPWLILRTGCWRWSPRKNEHSAYTEAYKVCSVSAGAMSDGLGETVGDEDQGRTSEEEDGGTGVNYDRQSDGRSRAFYIIKELVDTERFHVKALRLLQK
ncbi:hypothetical protein ATANTOWER_007553, partial [Ataeniobius toweri]|nr:hypothetical protein [Ataeniobius toweri]